MAAMTTMPMVAPAVPGGKMAKPKKKTLPAQKKVRGDRVPFGKSKMPLSKDTVDSMVESLKRR